MPKIAINTINCHAYVEKYTSKGKFISQCMARKYNLNDVNCIFCRKHQNIFDTKGHLKDGYYTKLETELFICDSSTINVNEQSKKHKIIKKELLEHNNYYVNKLKKQQMKFNLTYH